MRPAVFLDRDGTLLEEAGYVDRLERLVLFPFSVDAVRLLNRSDLAVVVVTNQSGVGRGIYDEDFVHRAHRLIAERMAAGGARIDGFYYCPHHPAAEIQQYRVDCDCRKPLPGMLRRAAAELSIDLSRSFTVGDKWSDVELARRVGARGILVRTGYGAATEQSSGAGIDVATVVDNLAAAAAWMLAEAARTAGPAGRPA